jgi:hypothetical protein
VINGLSDAQLNVLVGNSASATALEPGSNPDVRGGTVNITVADNLAEANRWGHQHRPVQSWFELAMLLQTVNMHSLADRVLAPAIQSSFGASGCPPPDACTVLPVLPVVPVVPVMSCCLTATTQL